MSTLSFHADHALEKRIRASAKQRKQPVSRFLKETLEQSLLPQDKVDVATLLDRLHAAGKGLKAEAAERYLKQVRADRKSWRG